MVSDLFPLPNRCQNPTTQSKFWLQWKLVAWLANFVSSTKKESRIWKSLMSNLGNVFIGEEGENHFTELTGDDKTSANHHGNYKCLLCWMRR